LYHDKQDKIRGGGARRTENPKLISSAKLLLSSCSWVIRCGFNAAES